MNYRNGKLLIAGLIMTILFTLVGALTSAQQAGPLGIIIRPPEERGLSIRIWEERGVYAIGDTIQIHFAVNQDAFVYIYNIDAAGTVRLIFPNAFAPNNFVRAGRHTIPDKRYTLQIAPPAGRNYIQAIASPVPLDIGAVFTVEAPFPMLGTDPAAFKAELLIRLQGIAPTPVWAEDWLSFQIVIGAPPAQGSLTVASTPPSAHIYIDGHYHGWTPRTIHLSPGTYHIRITKTGYYDWMQHVSVRAQHTRIVNVTLMPRVINEEPVASFTFTPPHPDVGGWIRFDATASFDPDGTIVAYKWNFGDGTHRTGQRPFHRFTTAGLFWVTLTVTDNAGATATKTVEIRVGPIKPPNRPPVASFTFLPPRPVIGDWIRFDATASFDPDGTIVAYKWDFGDGTRRTSPAVIKHRYTAPGDYTVTLTVTDNNGAMTTIRKIVRVAVVVIDRPPVARFTVIPPTPMIGELVTLNATASFDRDGWIVTYKWDHDGDGIYDLRGPIASVRYWFPGWQTIRLTVIDNIGLSATTTERIWIGPIMRIPPLPGVPPMAGIPGIFVWGTDRWNITINAGVGWSTPRRYRIELRTDGRFHDVDRAAPPGIAPLGIVPIPVDGGKTLIIEGDLIDGFRNYSFTVPDSESIWMRLQLDIDGDGTLDESSQFIYLGPRMVRPLHAPFVVGLPEDHPGPLVPTLNFRIGTAITYTAVMRFIIWITTIRALGG